MSTPIPPSGIRAALAAHGYLASDEVAVAARGAVRRLGASVGGATALLLTGAPGVGKSALAEALAGALGAELVVCQLHAWSDADELFVGVDVAAAVAGDAGAVRQPGVLARAAELAEEGLVVLLLDELDKAPERAEALLLDWLQSGRVPVAPGQHLRTRLDRVLVVITSNGQRPIGDAILRRCRRVEIPPLPVAVQEQILRSWTGLPQCLVRVAWKAARACAEADGALLSLQEGRHLLGELLLAESLAEVRLTLAGWAARGPAGQALARKLPQAAAVWGELRLVRG